MNENTTTLVAMTRLQSATQQRITRINADRLAGRISNTERHRLIREELARVARPVR